MIDLSIYLYGRLPKKPFQKFDCPYLFATAYEREQYRKRLQDRQEPGNFMEVDVIETNRIEDLD